MTKLLFAVGLLSAITACAVGDSDNDETPSVQPDTNQKPRDAKPAQPDINNTDSAQDAAEANADAEEEQDAGRDGGVDARPDTGADARTDSGADARADSGADARTDSGTDAGPIAPPCPGLVINEFQTEGLGGASDEFVELYNPGAASCSLVGFKLIYRSSTGTSNVNIGIGWNFAIAPQGYVVLAGSAFTGASNAALSSGLAAAGGQLQLQDGAGTVHDSLSYGNSRGAFMRVAPAPLQPNNGSVGRHGDGVDTGNNSVDFHTIVSPTPGAANP